MSAATYLLGDVFEVMATMPDNSVDLILTSPPFLALRSYLPADHPNKHKEIGSEPNPAEFIDTLLALTAEWERLLAPHGSIAVELGDTYSGSGGAGGDYQQGGMKAGQGKADGAAKRQRISPPKTAHRLNADGTTKHDSTRRQGEPKNQPMVLPQTGGQGWPLPKSMCLIPHLYAASLAYGVNILTGEQSPAGMWRVRNVIAWCRSNPTVGALGDKLRPATSFMVIACKSRDRWFDLDAVRTPYSAPGKTQRNGGARTDISRDPTGKETNHVVHQNPIGAPPLDWWEIPTEAYPGSHYATWPRRLLETPIESMCPREVCTRCGEPRRRITTDPVYIGTDSGKPIEQESWASFAGDTRHKRSGAHSAKNCGRVETATRTASTIGWTDCGCNAPWRNGHILDPFGGSGTTAVVATGHNRDCTLIDIDERNIDLAHQRVGMFLHTPEPEKAA